MSIELEKDSCRNCGNCKCGKKEEEKKQEVTTSEPSVLNSMVGGVVDFAGDVVETIAAIEIADTIGDVISGVSDIF